MRTRHHPLAHIVAILALVAGQVAMASTPCTRQMVPGMDGGMAAATHAGHAAPVPDEQQPSQEPGHPCCACTCPCRADLVKLPELRAGVPTLVAPTQRVPQLPGGDRLPTLLVATTLPPVRAPPVIA